MRFLPRLVFSFLGNAGLFWVLSQEFFPETFIVSGGIKAYAEMAIVFGGLNFFVKPLLNLFTLPFRWLTLGLFQFVVNASLIWALEQVLNQYPFFEASLRVDGLFTYVAIGFVAAVFNGVLHWFERK